MKVRTQTLSGHALNYVMAKTLGHEWRYPWMLEKDGLTAWLSSESAWGNLHPDFAHGEGALHIIETEIDCIRKRSKAEEAQLSHPNPNFKFKAEISGDVDGYYCAHGPTAVIAALRCFLVFKLGDEVELPKELMA